MIIYINVIQIFFSMSIIFVSFIMFLYFSVGNHYILTSTLDSLSCLWGLFSSFLSVPYTYWLFHWKLNSESFWPVYLVLIVCIITSYLVSVSTRNQFLPKAWKHCCKQSTIHYYCFSFSCLEISFLNILISNCFIF